MRTYNALGPALRSFGPNPKVAILLLIVGTFFSWLAFVAAREFRGTIAWTIFYLIAAGLGLLMVSHLSFRLWVHDSGISYRGIRGYNEIRWPDLERVYAGAYSIHAHYVPLGTLHRLRLMVKHGPGLSIGERVHGAEELTDLIQSFTLEEMLRRALHQYENGIEVDFGRIRIGRRTGVRYRKWFAWREIRWEDLTVYGVSDTHVNFSGARNLFPVNIAAEKVANVHVLEELLDKIVRQRQYR